MKSIPRRGLRHVYIRIVHFIYQFDFYRKRTIKFILPNLSKITRKKLIFDQYPDCSQMTKITGEGTVTIGKKCSFGYKLGGNFYSGIVEIQPRYKQSRIEIGNNVATNNNLVICAANFIHIGDDTLIGEGVTIMDHEAHGIKPAKRKQLGEIGSVIINKNVWIGSRVLILKNTVIGDNTIVAAGAVVSGEFPSNVIIGGVPAKIIKSL